MLQAPCIGVAFLACGLHKDWRHAFQRYVASYERHPAGVHHRLYVVFKGFENNEHLRVGERFFSRLSHTPIHTDDHSCDIGAYIFAARRMDEETICFLNTKSEMLCGNWLLKLARHLQEPAVGLVGNTGSFESHTRNGLPGFPDFPNVHIRTNAFLIRRELFRGIANGLEIKTKLDGWMFESGWNSLSRQILRRGLKILVIGRNGEAYEPHRWPASDTYRSPQNANVIVADDDYRRFPKLDPETKAAVVQATWGDYFDSPPQSNDELWRNNPCSMGMVRENDYAL